MHLDLPVSLGVTPTLIMMVIAQARYTCAIWWMVTGGEAAMTFEVTAVSMHDINVSFEHPHSDSVTTGNAWIPVMNTH